VKPTEVEWLNAYESWSDEIDSAFADGRTFFRAACEATFDDEVGDPPRERLQPTAAAARRGCAAQSLAGWRTSQADVVRSLLAVHGELLPPQKRPDVTEIVRTSVGVGPDVYCWQPPSWAELAPQYAIVRGGEVTSLDGIADAERNRIDLAPGVCATLDNYLRGVRPLKLSAQNLELAQALVVLAHQAEQFKAPAAPEAEIECYAIQHVRPLVRAAWGPEFAEEIALHAWQIAYPRLPPQFRTRACRDGGPLDRNPSSNAWP
jgi:hypothetical protein